MKNQYAIVIWTFGLLFFNMNLVGQIAINITGDVPNASSMLDVSSTEKGILIPRMTLTQRDQINSPVTGLMIYQTDNTSGFYFYNGTSWVVVGDGAISINSLVDGKTDSYSLFLGSGTGTSDNGASNRNTAVGINAYNSSVNGYANTAFGNETLKLNTSGTHNAAFGTQVLTHNITGVENTAIGTNAGFNVTGSGNVLIGANVAFSQTDISNKLFIDNTNTGTPLIHGDFITDILRVNGTLDINNAYQLPTSDGISGQILKTNGNGSLSWNDDTSASNINELDDGLSDGNSLYMGAEAGNLAGSNKFSTGVGVWSLKNVTTGADNTALGTSSLISLTEGSNNTVVGSNALQSITITSNNTVLGTTAGQSVTGGGNVFIGNKVAKTQTNISNKLFIDNSDTGTPLIYGEFDNDKVRVNGNFEISGGFKLESSTPGNGKVLSSDDYGNSSWTPLSGSIVGLGNVENTTLSTWAGSPNITTLGTISNGIWQSTPIVDSHIDDLDASKITSGIFNNNRINWVNIGNIGFSNSNNAKFFICMSSNTLDVPAIQGNIGDFSTFVTEYAIAAGGVASNINSIDVTSTFKIYQQEAGVNKVLTSDANGLSTWQDPSSIASDETGIKLLRGTINADGTVGAGNGFTVSKTGVGEYTIDFSTSFSSLPIVNASIIYSDTGSTNRIIAYVYDLTANSCKIETVDAVNSGFAEGTGFTFIAIGTE